MYMAAMHHAGDLCAQVPRELCVKCAYAVDLKPCCVRTWPARGRTSTAGCIDKTRALCNAAAHLDGIAIGAGDQELLLHDLALRLRDGGHGEGVRVQVRHHGVHHDRARRRPRRLHLRLHVPPKHGAAAEVRRPRQERQQPAACAPCLQHPMSGCPYTAMCACFFFCHALALVRMDEGLATHPIV